MNKKFRVTVSGWVKLLTVIAILLVPFLLKTEGDDELGVVLFSAVAYDFIFILLSVYGSNGKVANWFADLPIFGYIFAGGAFVLTVIVSIAGLSFKMTQLTACGVIVAIVSLVLSFLLIWRQGGIRRWDAYITYLMIPVVVYILSLIYPDKLMAVAGISAVAAIVIFFIAGIVGNIIDQRADISSSGDKSHLGKYTAKWESTPDSTARNNVLYLRGTVIVEYSGNLNESEANSAVQSLISSYAGHVQREMKGYSLSQSGHEITVKYRKMG